MKYALQIFSFEDQHRFVEFKGMCGEGNGNPFQYSCLENTMDRGAWWATVHGIAKGRTLLSDFISFHFISCVRLEEQRSKHELYL